MVEPIASKTVSSEIATTRVATAAPVVTAVAAPAPVAAPTVAQTSNLARTLAASPPVDVDRVATIKKAIAEGRFPIFPATIADRLLALKLDWHPSDAANEQA